MKNRTLILAAFAALTLTGHAADGQIKGLTVEQSDGSFKGFPITPPAAGQMLKLTGTSSAPFALVNTTSDGLALLAGNLAAQKTLLGLPQTTITGNAGTATALATARTIAGTSFNGTANINIDAFNLSGNSLATSIIDSSLQSFGQLVLPIEFETDNTVDIGSASDWRPRTVYSATSVISPVFQTASGIYWTSGAGSPEGSVTANVGALYSRNNGSTGTTLYVKETGTGNTGWVAAGAGGSVDAGTLTGPTLASGVTASSLTTFGTLAGHLIFTDNTYDIGASGATRPRTGYFGTSIVTPLVTATTLTGAAGGVTLDASGFDGNLTTSDNTLQEIAQKLDDISTGGSVATDAIFDAKGDLPVGTGANTSAKLTVGSNGFVLVADSGEATGLKWAAAGTGDVVGPGSSTAGAFALFDGTTGKLLQNGFVPGTGVATFLTTPSSANFASAITNETGTGLVVLNDTPTFIAPLLGTPTSGTLTNCTGYTVGNLSGLGSNVGTWLATPSSANFASAVTGETGSGALVFDTTPSFTTSAQFPDGSAAVPSISWTSDVDGSGTGLYRNASNSIAFSVNGSKRFEINNTQIASTTAVFKTADGDSTNPGYGFGSGTGYGFTKSSSTINLYTNGGASIAQSWGDSTGTSVLRWDYQVTGAASSPPLKFTGAFYAAGTGTTNFPQFFIQESGATAATTWNTAGTAIGVNLNTTSPTIFDGRVDGVKKFTVTSGGATASGVEAKTLAAAATALAVTSNIVTVTGDAGGNTVATITGGTAGQVLTLIFVDALVTITDDATAASNTVNLSAAFTSTANDTMTLVYDGTSWRETARSVN